MSAANPFFALQQRLSDLLEAESYFTGLTEKKALLTEAIGDLEFQVNNAILPLGFGVVVTTAAGKPLENSYEALITLEDLNISIMHNPTTDPAHNALDALARAIKAIHGQSVYSIAQNIPAPRPFDFFSVTGHQRRLDGPPGVHVHELHVTGGLRLL